MEEFLCVLQNNIKINNNNEYYKALVIKKNTNKKVKIKKESYIPMTGALFFIPPDLDIDIDEGIEYYLIYIETKFRESYIKLLGGFQSLDLHYKDSFTINTSLDFLLSTYERKRCVSFQLSYSEFQLLELSFINLLDQFENKDMLLYLLFSIEICTLLHGFLIRRLKSIDKFKEGEDYKTVEEIKSYIKLNINKKISLDELSKEFTRNSKDLNFMFRLIEKKTISEYILSEKIKLSCNLLHQEIFSIDEISSKIGINDTTYFYRIFKKKMGYTPKEYRKNKISKLGTL